MQMGTTISKLILGHIVVGGLLGSTCMVICLPIMSIMRIQIKAMIGLLIYASQRIALTKPTVDHRAITHLVSKVFDLKPIEIVGGHKLLLMVILKILAVIIQEGKPC